MSEGIGRTTPSPLLIDAAQIAVMLSCSPRHVHRMIDAGHIPPPLRLGGLKRWHRAAIEQWIAEGCPSVKRRRTG
jgi:prophage regulatory protein